MNGFEDNLSPRWWLCYDYCGGEENLYRGSSSAVTFLFIPALTDTCIVTPSITISKLKYSLTDDTKRDSTVFDELIIVFDLLDDKTLRSLLCIPTEESASR